MDSASKKTDRTRSISWADPSASARNASAISGLDYLAAIRNGDIPPPPVARLIGYRIARVEQGNTVFELDPAEFHYNPFATVHGGIACTLLDSSMTAAVLSTLPVGQACATIEIKTNFIRPITGKTGTVSCHAEMVHAGKSIAMASGKISDAKGNLYATGVSTLMIFSISPDLK
ncbi:MAG: PaaI family thioesterase [Desulfobacterales bacterium]|jgi:uncharacterized protein (TIGR00369 family)|nr:PaaI family thioesterase [Desulfobacterales bacterium]